MCNIALDREFSTGTWTLSWKSFSGQYDLSHLGPSLEILDNQYTGQVFGFAASSIYTFLFLDEKAQIPVGYFQR
jgi:hypothetical protein